MTEPLLKSKPPDLAKNAEETNSEHAHQTALFAFFRTHRELYPETKWLFAIPSGGHRSKSQAAILKAEGLKAGIPDMCLAIRRGTWPCLWIELKIPAKDGKREGRVSDEQKMWLGHFKSQGMATMVCYGWEHAKDIIIQYLNHG